MISLTGDMPANRQDAPPASRLYLIGPLNLVDPTGKERTPRPKKARAILALLALSPQASCSREWLTEILWQDATPAQGLASLRSALSSIRTALGPFAGELLVTDNDRVSLRLDRIEVDVWELVAPQNPRRIAPHVGAVQMTSTFLDGINVTCPAFVRWAEKERQIWKARFETAETRETGKTHSRLRTPPAAFLTARSRLQNVPRTRDRRQVFIMPAAFVGAESYAAKVLPRLMHHLIKALLDTEEIDVTDLSLTNDRETAGLSAVRPTNETAYLVKPEIVQQGQTVLFRMSVLHPDGSGCWTGSKNTVVNNIENGDDADLHALLAETVETLKTAFLQNRPTLRGPQCPLILSAVEKIFLLSRDDLDDAEVLLRHIIQKRPSSQGFAWLAFLLSFRVGQRFTPEDKPIVDEAIYAARKALELDRQNALTNALAGHIFSYISNDFVTAQALFDQAVRLNPIESLAWDLNAMLHSYTGEPWRALKKARWARHLAQNSRYRYYFDTTVCLSATFSGDPQTAISAGEQALSQRPEFNSILRFLVSCYAQVGEQERAESLLERLRKIEPEFTVASLYDAGYPGLNTEGGERFVRGLLMAGVKAA